MNSPPVEALADLRLSVDERLDAILAQWKRLESSGWRKADFGVFFRQVHGLFCAARMLGMHLVSESMIDLEAVLAALSEKGETPTAGQRRTVGVVVEFLTGPSRDEFIGPTNAWKTPDVQNREQAPIVGLVDGGPTVRDSELLGRLREQGYQLRIFSGASEVAAACSTEVGERLAVLVVDMTPPDGDEMEAELRAGAVPCNQQGIPVVVVSGRKDLAARLIALRSGASYYLTRPLQPSWLIGLLDEIADRPPAKAYRALVVADDPLLRQVAVAVLQSANMSVEALAYPLRLFEALDRFVPDVVVLGAHMEEVSGTELMTIVRGHDEYRHLPLLIVSPGGEPSFQSKVSVTGPGQAGRAAVSPELLVAQVIARARRARKELQLQRRFATAVYERGREHLALNQHAIMSVVDAGGQITYVNDKFCETSGYDRSELLGRGHNLVNSGVHPPEYFAHLWSTLVQGDVWQGDICNRSKDGNQYWLSCTMVPFLDEGGLPYQYVAICTDITQVKHAEAVQREQNRMQRLVSHVTAQLLRAPASQQAPAIGRLLRDVGEHLKADRAYLFLLADDGLDVRNAHQWLAPGIQASRHKLIDFPLIDAPWWRGEMFDRGRVAISDPANLPEEAAAEKAILAAHDVRSLFAFALCRKGKNWGFIGFDSIRKSRDWKAEQLDLLGVLADTLSTAFARWEFEQALERNKERLRRGQAFANIGTWDLNIDTGELLWSERVGPLLGFPEGDRKTSFGEFLELVRPEDRAIVTGAVNASLDDGAPFEIELRVVWPNGTERWLLERGAVVRDEAGKPVQMLGVVQDIDDRKRAELALAERERQLRHAQRLAHIGDWQADLGTGVMHWSDEVYRIFGYPPGKFSPDVDAFFASPDISPRWPAGLPAPNP